MRCVFSKVPVLAIAMLWLGMSGPIGAQSEGPPEPEPAPEEMADDPDIATLDTVVVSGAVQGPGLWRVSDAQGHELWILATLSPIPAKIDWHAAPVLAHVANAQQVLWEPYFSVDIDAGMFRKLALGWRFKRTERNPDGQTLRDLLPEATYERWNRLRAQYLPRERGLEDKRPIVAAQLLLNAAVKANGLSRRNVVRKPINDAAKAHGVEVLSPKIELNFSVQTARAAVAEARNLALRDLECMQATLDAVEQDVPRMITNANAWAHGELARIEFAQLRRRNRLCVDVFSDTELAQRYGLPDVRRSIRERWLDEAKAALARNQTTLSIVRLEGLIGADGYLAHLRAAGYTIEAPGEAGR